MTLAAAVIGAAALLVGAWIQRDDNTETVAERTTTTEDEERTTTTEDEERTTTTEDEERTTTTEDEERTTTTEDEERTTTTEDEERTTTTEDEERTTTTEDEERTTTTEDEERTTTTEDEPIHLSELLTTHPGRAGFSVGNGRVGGETYSDSILTRPDLSVSYHMMAFQLSCLFSEIDVGIGVEDESDRDSEVRVVILDDADELILDVTVRRLDPVVQYEDVDISNVREMTIYYQKLVGNSATLVLTSPLVTPGAGESCA